MPGFKKKNIAVTYSVVDELSPQVNAIANNMAKVDKQAEETTKSTDSLGGSFKKLAVAIGASAVAMKAISYGSKTIDAFKTQEKASARLIAVAKGVTKATDEEIESLQRLAEATQEVSTFSNEVVEAGQSQLLSYGITAKQAEALTGTLADLLSANKGVNATTEDAIQVANTLGKALNGQSGELARSGILLSEHQKALIKDGDTALRVATMVEVINDNYGGMAETMANTETGGIKAQENAIGDMQELIGKELLPIQAEWIGMQGDLTKTMVNMLPVISAMATGIGALFSTIGDIIDNKVALGLSALVAGFYLIPPAVASASTAIAGLGTTMTVTLPIIAGIAIAIIGVNKALDAWAGSISETAEASASFAVATAENYKKIAEQMGKYQELQAKGTELTKAEKKEMKSLEKSIESATGSKLENKKAGEEAILVNKWQTLTLEDLNKKQEQAETIETRNAKNKKERAEAEAKANDKKIADAKALAKAETEALKKQKEAEKQLLNDKKTAIATATQIQEEYHILQLDQWDKERYAVNATALAQKEAMLKVYAEGSDELKTLEMKRLQELEAIGEEEKLFNEEKAEKELEIEKKLLEARKDLRAQHREEQETLDRFALDRNLSFVQQGISAVASIVDASIGTKDKKRQLEIKKEREAIEASTASEEEKAKKLKALDKEAEDAKYKSAVADWKNSLIMSVVNTGLGVTKTMATMGFPAGIPFATAVGVAGAVQTGVIGANKPERMAEGGDLLGKGGSTVSDSVWFKGNAGEKVISKSRSRKLDNMIDNGTLGGGHNFNVEMPITVAGDATPSALDRLEGIGNDLVDTVVEALELAVTQNKVDPSRLAIGGF